MESKVWVPNQGDTVVLKSGSRYMTVEQLYWVPNQEHPSAAGVVWMVWETGVVYHDRIELRSLRPPNPRSDGPVDRIKETSR